jgi:FG-GAP-like repeat/Abnormal spindle-like microcephaly-assoc'd, ASPM-SPD-2-Hydin
VRFPLGGEVLNAGIERLARIYLLVGFLLGFTCFAPYAEAQNPIPFVNQPLVPTATAPGGPSFTLTVNGTGFVSGAVVNWNSTHLATTFISSSRLAATVPAENIATAQTASITVTNPAPGGGTSSVAFFSVSAPTTLQFTATFPTPVGGYQSIAGDFTNDGKTDLLVNTETILGDDSVSNALATFLGNGDGSFQAPETESTSIQAPLLSGDFNGDGILDLVGFGSQRLSGAPSSVTQFLSVELGNGDGTFTAKSETNLPNQGSGGFTQQMVTGDFNGDGKLDVALASLSGTSGGIYVFLGNGDGTLQNPLVSASATFSAPSSDAIGAIGGVGDFDGDGKLDLIAVVGTQLSWLRGNGDGTFQSPSTTYSVAANTSRIIAADLNGDGKLDLITVQSPDPTYTVFLGNGDGTFQPGVAYPSGGIPLSGGVIGDFNSDGKLDFVLSDNSETLLVLGNGDGTFQFESPLVLASGAGNGQTDSAAADFNNDGKLDLAIVGGTSSPFILLQETPLPGFSPSSVTFAAQPIGTASPSQSVTLTNTGTGPLSISGIAVGGANPGDFSQTNNCPATLAAGANCQINITFTPSTLNGRSATLSLADNAPASPQSIPLSGTGGQPIVVNPSTLSFNAEAVGSTAEAQPVTLSNTGGSTLTITSISITGTDAIDFAETNGCGPILAAGASCSIQVTFTPTAIGTRNAALTISSTAPGGPQSATLTGTGTLSAILSPAKITFPNQYVGTSGLPQSVTLTNPGSAPLTITKVTTSPSDFAPLSACSNTLAPGASCSIGVFFDPTGSGVRNGTLTVTDNLNSSPLSASLTGVGQDFSMAVSQSTATVSPGQTANYSVSIAPGGGFNQTVTLSCSGTPAMSTCSVSPSSVALNGPTSAVTVSVITSGSSAVFREPMGVSPSGRMILALRFACFGIVGLAILASLTGSSRERAPKLLRRLAFLLLLCIVGVGMSACNGGSNGSNGGGTQPGTYNLTVTGTFAAGTTTLSHTTKLTLVVR